MLRARSCLVPRLRVASSAFHRWVEGNRNGSQRPTRLAHIFNRIASYTRFDESLAQFSPDGRWMAYQTNDSSRFEIVVQAFPDPNGRQRCPPTAVSSRDGAQTSKSSTLSRRTESSGPQVFRRRVRTLR